MDYGKASAERERVAKANPHFEVLKRAVFDAACRAYLEGEGYLRSNGGITAIMKKAASANDRSYVGLFGVPRPMSELLDYPAIRIEAMKVAGAGKK